MSIDSDICHLRHYGPPVLELFVLAAAAAQMCHQHEQDKSGSDADVEQMNTRAPQSWQG